MDNDSLTFKISNDQLYVDDEKLSYNRTTKNLFDNIIRFFDTRSLEGVRLLEAVTQASAREILAFMRLLDISGQQPEPLAWLKDSLAAENIEWVELVRKRKDPRMKNPTRARLNGGKGPEKTILIPRPLSKKLPRRSKREKVRSVSVKPSG